MTNHFASRLMAAIQARRTPVLVGLDPRVENLPRPLADRCDAANPASVAESFRQFCQEVIDVVADLVAAVKPQAAFFEQAGPAGMQALAEIIAYARRRGLIVILDGKRNDIGVTAEAYARAYLGVPPDSPWGADALTVSPYLGDDSLTPFREVAEQRGAGVFVLVKTSNPGGGRFQDLIADGKPVFEHVAELVESMARETCDDGPYGSVGAVIGATYPQQLAELREKMPHTFFLVPGFGAQGGSARDVAGAFDRRGHGAIINNSRGIIFAYERQEYQARFQASQWQDAVAAATRDMADRLRADTSAGNL